MATGKSIIAGALKLLQVKQSGEALSADEQADGMETINDFLDSLTNQKLMIPALVEITHTLVAGTQSYTIGASGTINTTWPRRLESAHLRRTTSGETYDYEIEIIKNARWSNIVDKGIQTDYPRYLYIRQDFPLATINLWPKPDSADVLVLQAWDTLTQVTDMTATLSFPPGYNEFLKYNIALRLAPEYIKGQVHPEVTKTATDTMYWIKTANADQTPQQRFEVAHVTGRGRGNIFTGGI